MKKRNGFVSNSSSSSFLIGLAKIDNVDEVKNIIKDNKWEFRIEKYDGYDISVSCFRGDKLTIGADKLNIGDDVLIIDHVANEGDSYFIVDDEIDYDIELDDIDEDILDKFDKIIDHVDHLEYIFGADRNG